MKTKDFMVLIDYYEVGMPMQYVYQGPFIVVENEEGKNGNCDCKSEMEI